MGRIAQQHGPRTFESELHAARAFARRTPFTPDKEIAMCSRLLTCVLALTISACAVPRTDVQTLRPEAGSKLPLPVKATLLVHEPEREKSLHMHVNGRYGSRWVLWPGKDLESATLAVARNYFSEVKPFTLNGEGHLVLKVSGKPSLDIVWGNYKTVLSTELYAMDGTLIEKTKTTSSTVSMVINDENAFYNSYAKAMKTYLDRVFAANPDRIERRTFPVAPKRLAFNESSLEQILTLESTGSGFHVDRDGHVLTNHHVIAGCLAITVNRGGRHSRATLVASDEKNDLAVLRTAETSDRFARFAVDETPVRLGDSVITVGFPLHGVLSSNPSVTTGSVSALAGLRDDLAQLQISAPIQPGNSGGPLLGNRGQVYGVVQSSIDAVRLARFTGDLAQNVNFAMKAKLATDLMGRAGVAFEVEPKDASTPRSVPDIAEEATRYTVQVMCFG